MTLSAFLVTFATHPFQIALAVTVVIHAARAILSTPSERHDSRIMSIERLAA